MPSEHFLAILGIQIFVANITDFISSIHSKYISTPHFPAICKVLSETPPSQNAWSNPDLSPIQL